MSGGEVSGNTATGLGGGIYAPASAVLNGVIENAKITGNTANGEESNLYYEGAPEQDAENTNPSDAA